jgi:hypothetical protein
MLGVTKVRLQGDYTVYIELGASVPKFCWKIIGY